MRKLLISLTIILAATTAVSAWLTQDSAENFSALAPAAGGSDNAGSGEALIGGSFTLTDQNGNTVSDSVFRGRLMLVFFGFTHCPDICPISTAALSKTMELLGDKADKVAPVFITVDPKRDTPSVLKDYFSNFDKRIVGLTGSPDDIQKVADAYKAYYSHTDPAGNDATAHGAHYMVDHSGYIYLMDKNGKYLRHFSYDASPQDMAKAVEENLK